MSPKPSSMEYRAYQLDKNDRILKRFYFEAADGSAALEHAKQYVDGHDIEVWQDIHIVGRLAHKR